VPRIQQIININILLVAAVVADTLVLPLVVLEELVVELMVVTMLVLVRVKMEK
jgi:hypothetical protein